MQNIKPPTPTTDPAPEIAAPGARAGRGAGASGPTIARRAATLGLASLAAAALVSACGGSGSSAESNAPTGKRLDVTRVTKSIEESILSEKHMHANVTCPSDVEQRKGVTFTCYATGYTGTGTHRSYFKTPFEVTEENSLGYVQYHS
ncbi:MAG: DUF4333 domain-containing protein [Solirubrobacteraceae bacterium]